MSIHIFDKSQLIEHTNVKIISQKYDIAFAYHIKKLFQKKFHKKYICNEAPCEIIKTHAFEIRDDSSIKNKSITIFNGKFKQPALEKIYAQFIDPELYSFDKIENIFSSNKIIALNNGKLSYYERENFGTYPFRYWRDPFSYHNVAKIIDEINDNNSAYHSPNKEWLYPSLIRRFDLIKLSYFVLMIMTDDKFDLPVELRCRILYVMLSLYNVFE
uniref:Uncharacterized protein n=1 Tax=viral metagenome TaxID=1070528 RepID=A0A6C0C7M3_9ZZZZ